MPAFWVIQFAVGIFAAAISGKPEIVAIGCFLIAHAAYNEK